MLTKVRGYLAVTFLLFGSFIPSRATEPAVLPQHTVNISDFGGRSDGSDTTRAVRKALDYCKTLDGAVTLCFPKGRYDFLPEAAQEKYFHVGNNDNGIKRVAFPLFGVKNVTIDGQGSDFIFHEFLCPVIVETSSNVSLKNFSIDFDRPFHSEAVVLQKTPEGVDLEIPAAFPYTDKYGVLNFLGAVPHQGKKMPYSYGSILEFDSVRRETAYMARDYWLPSSLPVKPLGGRNLRLLLPGIDATPGNILVFGPNHREVPGIFLTKSSDVLVQGITIYHAGGMGVIGQNSHNVTVDRCKVTPAPGRILSATADAVHFVNCTGKIEISGNLFENQNDDGINIHGVYAQVSRLTDSKTFEVRFVHPQQRGFEMFDSGTDLELVQAASLITMATGHIANVETLNQEYTRITLTEPVPAGFKVGDVVAAVLNYPEVYIHDNIFRNNRARGILLGGRGKTVVENNVFHSPGAAILFGGGTGVFFEEGGARDCTIRSNLFDNCLFGVWGKAVIIAAPHVDEKYRAVSRYSRNILIENNTFRISDGSGLLSAHCVDGLIWRKNTVQKTTDYPAQTTAAKQFDVSDCDHVSIE